MKNYGSFSFPSSFTQDYFNSVQYISLQLVPTFINLMAVLIIVTTSLNMYLKNSLIPSLEKEPRKMEYFIFLALRTAIAG